jgi:RNA polymerase sigma-70 factor (ECF subfamily)
MTNDLFSRLSAADPAAEQDRLSVPELTARAQRVLEHASAPSGLVRTRVRRRWLLAVPTAVAVALAIVVAPSFVGPKVDAQAAELLTDAASAISTTDPSATPAQWWRVAIIGEALNISGPSGTTLTTVPTSSVEYVAVDGNRPSYVVDGVGAARQVTTATLTPNEIGGSWQAPDPAFLSGLPRDTQALRDRLYSDTAGHGQSRNGEVFVYVADVLRSGLVPADLRASLYRVLATVPGVRVSSHDARIGGRTGVAFSYDEAVSGTLQEIVIDTATGDLVGEREVVVDSSAGLPIGTVMWQSSNSRSLVDSVPARIVAAAVTEQCTGDVQSGVICTTS